MTVSRALVTNVNTRVVPTDTLWCQGDWAFGRISGYERNARWFRDQIQCRTVFFLWGNHDKPTIRDLFNATYDRFISGRKCKDHT